MRQRLLKVIIVLLIIFMLEISNIVLLCNGIVIAVNEELESQKNTTNVENVHFDTYFLNNGQIVHSKENDIDNKETLILSISVKDKGSLNNAKIRLENTNFNILKDEINNQYVKNVNINTNEIELNQIIYQNDVKIEIPINFKKQENFDENYFEKESTITITGIYAQDDKNSKEISSKISIKMIWKHSTDVKIAQNVEKFININGKTILQQYVITSVEDNKLPRENEILNVIVPDLDENKPNSVEVLLNDENITEEKVSYNKETGIVEIKNESKGIWSAQENRYKLIYEYENIEFTNKNINLNTNIRTKLYTQNEMIKNDVQNIEISPIGNIVSLEKQTTDSKYKGYLYTNSSNLTQYDEIEKVEISNEAEINNINITQEGENFLDEYGNNFDISSKTVYLGTIFNKKNIIDLFGENVEIRITDINNNVLSIINKETLGNELGNIEINYETPVKGIKIETTKPIKKGVLCIRNKKAIEGNTGYTKEDLKHFVDLSSKSKVVTNISEEIKESKIKLLDTTTEAKLDINKMELSALEKNEDVNITVTLKTSSEKYDLFKDPVIEVELPESVRDINVEQIRKLYGDMFNVEYATLVSKDNGRKSIVIAMKGEQTEYSNEINETSIVISCDIEFDILTPSKTENISLYYSNENGNEKNYNLSKEIKIKSKAGMMVYNELSEFNNSGDKIYTIDDNIPQGILDINSQAKTATVKTAIVNNYESEINDLVIIGRIPKNEFNGSTLDTNLFNIVNVNVEGAEILYSQNTNATKDDIWNNDYKGAGSYIVKINSLQPGEVVQIEYQITIPENITYGQSIYEQTEVEYSYLGNTNKQISKIGAKTEEVITNNILALANTVGSEINGLGIAISTVSGGVELKDGDSVYEGQKIRYTIEVTNNTGRDVTNINVNAAQTNGNIYDLIGYEAFDPAVEEEPTKIYHLYGELDTNEKTFDKIDVLPNGESIILYYETAVLEVTENGQQTYGEILLTADNIEQTNITTIKNNIEQAELKLSIANSFFEEETIYLGDNVHMNLDIENISGKSLNNVKATVKLPEGVYCNDETDVAWSRTTVAGEDKAENNISNAKYDRENNIMTFEISNMEAEELTEIELYVQISDFEGKERDIPFMFEANVENRYVSNMATIRIHNEKRNVNVTQSTNIEDGTLLKDEDIFELKILVENNDEEELNFTVFDTLPDGFTAKSAKVKYLDKEEEIEVTDELFPAEGEEEPSFIIRDNIFTGEKLLAGNTSMEITITIEIDIELIREEKLINNVTTIYGKLAEEGEYKYDWSYQIETDKEFNMQLTEAQENWVEVVQYSTPENNAVLEDGQEISYLFEVRNITNNDITVTLYDYLPKGVILEDIILNNEKIQNGDIYIEGYKIPANATITLKINGYIDIEQVPNEEIINNLTVSTVVGDVVSNDIIFKVVKEDEPIDPEDPDKPDPDNPDEPDNPDPEDPDPDDPDNPNPDEPDKPTPSKQHTISGVAWIDENKDGRREASELGIVGIKVRAIEVETGNLLDNVVTTSSNGRYELTLDEGKYILIFEYDDEKYLLTDYRKSGVQENQNSDVVNKNITINGEEVKVGATDTIELTEDIENIDIGLVYAKVFDLELNKYVSEITVETNRGTTKYSYGDETLAKVEIHSKEINNATVIIKYKIKIKNTGEISGYVQNVVDNIPKDLEFNSELNKDWYKTNSVLENNSLANTIIEPGEEKELELVLTKNMTNSNTGIVINTAEIEEESNTQGIADIDSVPGNNDTSEDDFGTAQIIITVSTGKTIIFVTVVFTALITIAVGAILIKKKVLR